MAVLEPYSPCPCGSGQKFKWCCHKVEAYAERAHRLFDNGQAAAAVEALDEGLRKEAGNPWLLMRKALYLTRTGQVEPAKDALKLVVAKNPAHAGAQMLMTRLVLESEGPSEGAAQLQTALTALPPEHRKDLVGLVRVVGAFLSEAGSFAAAIKHLRLAQVLETGEADSATASTLRAVLSNPGVSPLLKNPDTITSPPSGLSGEVKDRFNQAVGWANEGLWASAASAFETLRSDPLAGPFADRNLGFCRLWLAEDGEAASALRRYAARLGTTEEAVDVEALCQQVVPQRGGDLVEHVQLTWPIRNRDALLDALEADPSVSVEEPAPIDPEDPDSPEVDQYTLLDRPELKTAGPDVKMTEIPRIVGRVLVGSDVVALETYDDGRLDKLSQRFMSIAGAGIPPAHPRTKLVGKVPRVQLALMWEWLLPEGIDPATSLRLTKEQGRHLIGDVWPNIPLPALRGKTPLQAAAAGDSQVPLRAAVLQFTLSREAWSEGFDFNALRDRLHLPPEPGIDPSTVDVETLHLARLQMVSADQLPDDKLGMLYRRARTSGLDEAAVNAAKILVGRPEALEKLKIESITIYTDLASQASASGRIEESTEWIRKGRLADAPAKKARNAPSWDMFEVRLRARTVPPETWVPEIAIILDRYSHDPQATQTVMMNLIDMGLLELVQNPDRPGEVLLDSRPFQALLSEYGPRVTTASGRLGVSATKPEIWTPGSPGAGGGGGGGGGLWTPGSGAPAPSANQPAPAKKLIFPGR